MSVIHLWNISKWTRWQPIPLSEPEKLKKIFIYNYTTKNVHGLRLKFRINVQKVNAKPKKKIHLGVFLPPPPPSLGFPPPSNFSKINKQAIII